MKESNHLLPERVIVGINNNQFSIKLAGCQMVEGYETDKSIF